MPDDTPKVAATEFDPDEFMKTRRGGTAPATTEFDPDEFMKTRTAAYPTPQFDVEKMKQPTEFEKERNPENQQGFLRHGLDVLGNQIGSLAKSTVEPYTKGYETYEQLRGAGKGIIPSMLGGTAMGVLRAGPSGVVPGATDQIENIFQLPEEYKERRGAGYGRIYSALAPTAANLPGVNLPSMEHQADIGNARGVLAEAAVPAGEVAAMEAVHAAPESVKALPKRAVGATLDAFGNPLTLGMSPEEMLTKGVKPRAQATGWQDAIARPGVQRAIQKFHIENPDAINGVKDLAEAIPDVRNAVWDERIAPAVERQGHLPLQMDKVADNVRKAITPEMRRFEPENAKQIEGFADELAKSTDVAGANGVLKWLNGKMTSYFAKYPSARYGALLNNPDIAMWDAAREGIRNEMLGAMERVGETDIREARQDYGGLKTIEKEVEKKGNVADRKNPIGIFSGLGGLIGGGGIGAKLGGVVGGPVGAALGTGLGYGAGRLIEHLNDRNVLTRRAIEKMNPPQAAPFVPPSPFVPPAPAAKIPAIAGEQIPLNLPPEGEAPLFNLPQTRGGGIPTIGVPGHEGVIEPIGRIGEKLPGPLPEKIYRVRDVGSTELNPQSHAHATESLAEAERYKAGRETLEGKPQEIVAIDTKGMKPGQDVTAAEGPNGPRWFKIHHTRLQPGDVTVVR